MSEYVRGKIIIIMVRAW